MTGATSKHQNHLLQQDFVSYREFTNDKLQRLDEKMDMFHITELLRQKSPEREPDFVNPFGAREGATGRRTTHVGHMNAKGFSKTLRLLQKLKVKGL